MTGIDGATPSPGPRSDGRAALIAAAWQELAEHGTSGLSLRAVARRAGVSHAAPKHHFENRAGLLTALAIEGFRCLRERFATATAEAPDTPVEMLAALGHAYLDFSLTQPDMFEVMYGTEPLNPDDPELAAQRRHVLGVLSSRVVGTGPGPGVTDGSPVPDETLMAWSLIHGLVIITRDGSLQRATGSGTAADTAALAHRLTDRFSDLLRAAIATQIPAAPG